MLWTACCRTQLATLSTAKVGAYTVLQDYFASMAAKAAARAVKQGGGAWRRLNGMRANGDGAGPPRGKSRRGALQPVPRQVAPQATSPARLAPFSADDAATRQVRVVFVTGCTTCSRTSCDRCAGKTSTISVDHGPSARRGRAWCVNELRFSRWQPDIKCISMHNRGRCG